MFFVAAGAVTVLAGNNKYLPLTTKWRFIHFFDASQLVVEIELQLNAASGDCKVLSI